MPINNPRVFIVLLNYNGYEDTIDCFKSLQKISYDNYDIVIIDNDSPDMSLDDIIAYMQENDIDFKYYASPEKLIDNAGNCPKVSLIQSGFNRGYGHGNNIGIKYALHNGADYILVLNNDTVVEPDFLEPMVEMCEKDKNIGIASGKIYYYDRPDTLWFNGGKFDTSTGKVKHNNFNEKDIDLVSNESITFITGCMWLIPKKVFDDVGFINEEYFMYVEDLEFCKRVLDKNYKLIISSNSVIYHKVGSASGGVLSSFSIYWMAKNKVKFIKKNIQKKYWIIAFTYLIFTNSIRFILKNPTLIKNHIKGIIDGIK